MNVVSLPLHLVDPPTHDDRLERTEETILEMVSSLSSEGQISPITVRPKGERFECIAGWTRTLAARRMGWATIAASLEEHADDRRTRRVRAAENLQRSQLSPIEEARAAATLMKEEGVDVDAAARALHRTRAWIEGRLQLLQLPEDLQLAIHVDKLPMTCAAILAEVTEAAHREYLTHYAVRHGANAHVMRDWVNQWKASHDAGGEASPPRPDMSMPPSQIVVMVDCFRCALQHDHRTSAIARICKTCMEELTRGDVPTA